MRISNGSVAIFLACCMSCSAASILQNKTADDNETSEAKQRRAAVSRVKSYASRMQAYDDEPFKVTRLTELAAALCRHDRDAAADTFRQAQQSLLRQEQARKGSRPPVQSDAYLRSIGERLLQRARECDATLVEDLGAELRAVWSGVEPNTALQQKMQAAVRELDTPEKAADAAIEAAKLVPSETWRAGRSGSSGPTIQFVNFLRRLQERDRQAADRAFLAILAGTAQAPGLNISHLLALGLYLFAADEQGARLPAGSLSVSAMHLGDVEIIHLNVARPDLSAEVAAAYVRTLVDVLWRSAPDPSTREAHHFIATRMRDKVREFAPERLADLDTLIAAATRELPPEAIQRPAREAERERRIRERGGQTEAELESVTDDDQRDAAYVALAMRAVDEGDPKRARALAAKLRNDEARASLDTIILMAEGQRALSEQRTDHAEEIAARMANATIRCALRIAIAGARARSGEKERALEGLLSALADARALGDARTPHLEVAAANVLARLDPRVALDVLALAIPGLKKEEIVVLMPQSGAPGAQSTASTASTWRRSIAPRTGAGGSSSHPLAVEVKAGRMTNYRIPSFPDFDTTLRPAVSALAPTHFDEVESLVLLLENQQMQAGLFNDLARTLLSKVPAPRPPRSSLP